MPLFIDQKYANLVASALPLFKWQGKSANFRCPLCGDSKTSATKKRGYFYEHKDTLMMKCHNCLASMPFSLFLKNVNPVMYKEYLNDAFQFNNDHRWYKKNHEERNQRVDAVLETKKHTTQALDVLTKVADLSEHHPCKVYVRQRKIPLKYWNELYFAENYQKWIHQYVDKTKFKHSPKHDYRLVIPFKTAKGKVFAYQGRYIGNDSKVIRYITISPNPDSVLIFGIDKINTKQRVWAFEGPIDSMYIANSVACAGSSLAKLKRVTFVFDNEPRNKEICKAMSKIINRGSEIVIWPKTFKHKDVGEAVENGMTSDEILDIMNNNVYNSLQANLKFNHWKIV